MCEMQKLRASVEQILTAAAEEIFGVFKRSIAEIEEKFSDSTKHNNRKRRLQESGQQTECPSLIQKVLIVKEEILLEQQERSPRLDQMDPESPYIKEEEDVWTNQEGEQVHRLEEADITKFPSSTPSVKSEYDGDGAQSSQFHHSQIEENTEEPEDGDDDGSEPDSIQNNDIPMSDVACKSTHQYTEEDKICMFSSALETQMTDDTTQRPFSCSVCNKCFVHYSKLKQHMLVHTGEKPFTCSVCKKGFGQKSNLNNHMLVHTGEKPFSCSICKKGFGQKSNLNSHMLVHTGEKRFSCPACNKGFARKFEVKQHMLVHTGEKPFSCPVCKKSFVHEQNLKMHVKSHGEESLHLLSS